MKAAGIVNTVVRIVVAEFGGLVSVVKVAFVCLAPRSM
jgi:hypothetical protein